MNVSKFSKQFILVSMVFLFGMVVHVQNTNQDTVAKKNLESKETLKPSAQIIAIN